MGVGLCFRWVMVEFLEYVLFGIYWFLLEMFSFIFVFMIFCLFYIYIIRLRVVSSFVCLLFLVVDYSWDVSRYIWVV